MAALKARTAAAVSNPEALADIGRELETLDAAIKSTDSRLEEFIPDDLFFGDVDAADILDHALEVLGQKTTGSPVVGHLSRG